MTKSRAKEVYLSEVINAQVDLPLALLVAQLSCLSVFTWLLLDLQEYWLVSIWSIVCLLCFLAPYVIRHLPWWQNSTINERKNCVFVLAFVHGVAIASVVVFFPYLDIQYVYMVTLVLLGFVSGSVAVTRGHQGLTSAFSLPVCSALIIGWLWLVGVNVEWVMRLFIAILIVLFFICHLVIARSIERKALALHRSKNTQMRIAQELNVTNKKLQESLEKEKSANEAKINFLAQASHDLRQPIHSLSLFNAALSMQELDANSNKIVDRMESAISHLAGQMDLMLDVSKLDAGLMEMQKTTFDLSKLIDTLFSQYIIQAKDKGLVLSCKNTVNSVYVNTDREQLSRIIENVLSNAIKYTELGSIEVKLTESSSRYCSLSVIDTGIGIEEKELGRIFDEFYQVKNSERDRRKGLGLGLSIVKRLCDELDIEFAIDSVVKSGTVFTLKLRHEPQLAANSTDDSAEKSISFDNMNLLCVDDEQDVLDAMQALLKQYKCNVYTATTSQAALEILIESSVDLLISDFRLAENKNGIELIHQARKIRPSLPSLLISGDTSPARLLQAAEASIRILHKPVMPDQLKDAIFNEFENHQ